MTQDEIKDLQQKWSGMGLWLYFAVTALLVISGIALERHAHHAEWVRLVEFFVAAPWFFFGIFWSRDATQFVFSRSYCNRHGHAYNGDRKWCDVCRKERGS